ncbi:hypothetical protein B005_0582 [Nocardiopsis alba ATCC BAA-2165]|uniref:Uncharacterized protein n=1 Tax=Nocardiopsis alba (strain ATCC BAA-2165 / BE74) TaxID=1205910 RepID=J7LBJ1_NOCAA|nr:hypothetical protein B005_0582 [Nocardiopsis alba ATCC BAA-2165]
MTRGDTRAPDFSSDGRRFESCRVRHESPDQTRHTRTPQGVLVAVLAISCLLIEGLVTDWSALLITRDLGAEPAQGAGRWP